MENIIHIGGRVDKETSNNLKDYVVTVFKAGKEHHMDQSTIVEALRTISNVGSAENATISGSNFIGEKHVHIDSDDDGK